MLNLALWLKANKFRPDQVQAFIPTPLAIASAMYHAEKNPLKKVDNKSEQVLTAKGTKQRRLHKAFLRYHDVENWPILRDALKRMGRTDLIGNGKKHLVPAWQPKGTGLKTTDSHHASAKLKHGKSKQPTTRKNTKKRAQKSRQRT